MWTREVLVSQEEIITKIQRFHVKHKVYRFQVYLHSKGEKGLKLFEAEALFGVQVLVWWLFVHMFPVLDIRRQEIIFLKYGEQQINF